MLFNPKKKIKLTIQSLGAQAQGLAEFQAQSISVMGALPGEIIELEINPRELLENKTKFSVAKNKIKFLKNSPDRVMPPCPHFGVCGGCQLQHLSYESQLRQKEAWLQKALERCVEPEKILPIEPSPKPYQYRRRAQFHVSPQGELGFLAAQSHQVIPIQQCLLLEDPLQKALPGLQEKARQLVDSKKRSTMIKLELTLDEGILPVEESRDERAFVQNNRFSNEKLLHFLESKLLENKDTSALEIYAGDGNFSRRLASLFFKYAAVESNAFAVETGRKKTRELGLKIEWRKGEAANVLHSWDLNSFPLDYLIADPPRLGLGEAIPKILKLKIPQMIYISCSLKTLTMDLKKLMEVYDVEWVKPFDFFPQTTHLETVVGLKLRSVPSEDRIGNQG